MYINRPIAKKKKQKRILIFFSLELSTDLTLCYTPGKLPFSSLLQMAYFNVEMQDKKVYFTEGYIPNAKNEFDILRKEFF